MAKKTIPVILTEADWNKKKGAIAKMAGETGVGAAMKKVKLAFDKVDWDDFDPDTAIAKAGGKALDLDKFDDLFKQAKAEYPKVEVVRKSLYDLRDVAKKTQATFKSSKLIPASSTKHVGDIVVAAEHFAVELKSIDVLWANKRKEIAEKVAEYRKLLAKQVSNLETGLQKINKNPTTEEWKTAMHQQIRGLNAQLSIQPDTKQFTPKMTPYAVDNFVVGVNYPNQLKEREDILAKAKLVKDLLDDIKNVVK